MIKERISLYFNDNTIFGWSKRKCEAVIRSRIDGIENQFWINTVPYIAEHTHFLIRFEKIVILHDTKNVFLTPIEKVNLRKMLPTKYKSYSVGIDVDIYFEYEKDLNLIKLKHPTLYKVMCSGLPSRQGNLSDYYRDMIRTMLSSYSFIEENL